MIDWNKVTLTKADHMHISHIIDRITSMGADAGLDMDRMDLQMDIEACTIKCPLKLEELADADDFNLAHDVCGISRHLNRDTGELENCFLPRFHA